MVLVTMMLVVTGQVFADESHVFSEVWLSSKTSPLLNRSTIALAGGHYRRGAHFARAALKERLSETDHLIANHNLCLSYLRLGQGQRAERFCTLASDIAYTGYNVSTIRGAHYIVSRNMQNNEVLPSLSAIVIANIYQNSKSPEFALSRK
ncbi:MAG: hypothetical protein V3R68_00785 [Gammaproteobacteria bacterium]